MGVYITTIVYIKVLIIQIGSTIVVIIIGGGSPWIRFGIAINLNDEASHHLIGCECTATFGTRTIPSVVVCGWTLRDCSALCLKTSLIGEIKVAYAGYVCQLQCHSHPSWVQLSFMSAPVRLNALTAAWLRRDPEFQDQDRTRGNYIYYIYTLEVLSKYIYIYIGTTTDSKIVFLAGLSRYIYISIRKELPAQPFVRSRNAAYPWAPWWRNHGVQPVCKRSLGC